MVNKPPSIHAVSLSIGILVSAGQGVICVERKHSRRFVGAAWIECYVLYVAQLQTHFSLILTQQPQAATTVMYLLFAAYASAEMSIVSQTLSRPKQSEEESVTGFGQTTSSRLTTWDGGYE